MAADFSVCLFCSAAENLPETAQTAARCFGEEVARRGWRLVYGGSARGLMGIAARAAIAAGGRVLGIMPGHLTGRESVAADITELRIVRSLAERKELMIQTADAFLALPGGVGTLDELLEVISTYDIGLHAKPTVLCNVDGFWDSFAAMIEAQSAYGVIRQTALRSFAVAADVDAALAMLAAHAAPETVG